MAAPNPAFRWFSITRAPDATPRRRTWPLPLLSTIITSKSCRVCRPRDSTHSCSLASAFSVGITTDTLPPFPFRTAPPPRFVPSPSKRMYYALLPAQHDLPGLARHHRCETLFILHVVKTMGDHRCDIEARLQHHGHLVPRFVHLAAIDALDGE